MKTFIPVILSGGVGSRLWPESREGHPKPFIKLPDGETLIEKTYRRIALMPGVLQVKGKPYFITVTNHNNYPISLSELQKVGEVGSYLLEPFGRNTAPAIAMAAHQVQEIFGPDTLMLVVSADHLIQNEAVFAAAVQKAALLASSDRKFLVTFGLVPTTPETGFGYIKVGKQLEGGFQVETFIEKPDVYKAKEFVESGNYFWNSGMFCFEAGQFLSQLCLHAPEVGELSEKCWKGIKNNLPINQSKLEIPEELFKRIPNISIDNAVMEKSDCVAVVPSNFGWKDIGSWNAMRDLIEPDENENRSSSNVIFLNCKNTFVKSKNRLVAAIGLENITVIDTADALLVLNSSHSQDVKQIFVMLEKSNSDAFGLNKKEVFRPWGSYNILSEDAGFKVKRIEVNPGGKLSLQAHQYRNEHWVVVVGEAFVTSGDQSIVLKYNQSLYIEAGCKHRLENRTENQLILIEIQCGKYVGEDDITRFEDDYGRV